MELSWFSCCGVSYLSDKRFEREEDSSYIKDNITGKRVLYVEDIVDDLNELYKEYIESKEEVKVLKEALVRCAFDER